MSSELNIWLCNCKHQELYPHTQTIFIVFQVLVRTSSRIGHHVALVSVEFSLAYLSFSPTLALVFWPYKNLLKPFQMLDGFCSWTSIVCSGGSTYQNSQGFLAFLVVSILFLVTKLPLFVVYTLGAMCSCMPFDFHCCQ